MKEYLAENLIKVHNSLFQALTTTFKLQSAGSKTAPYVRRKIRKLVEFVKEQSVILGFRSTTQGAARMLQTIRVVEPDKLQHDIQSLSERLHDDMVGFAFLYLQPEKLRYRNQSEPFGDAFRTNFPKANGEAIEAGNCFALGRHTACVYHLMRATEIAVRVLFVALGMPPRVWSTTKWSKILERIHRKIEKNNQTLATDSTWQTERGFYESAHGFLSAIRVPLRNATMHVETTYDETGAEIVYDAVKSFMRHIATKLKETA